jgi:hypothetical protein
MELVLTVGAANVFLCQQRCWGVAIGLIEV